MIGNSSWRPILAPHPPKCLWARQPRGKTRETAWGRRPPWPTPPLAENAQRPRLDERHAQCDRRGGDGLAKTSSPVACSPRPARVGRAPIIRERSHDVLETHRSGSAKMKSNTIAAAPSSASLFVSSARRVRGQATVRTQPDFHRRRRPREPARPGRIAAAPPLEGIENEIAQIVEKQRLSQPQGKSETRTAKRKANKRFVVAPSPPPLSPKTPCFDPGGRRSALPPWSDAAIAEDTKVKIVEKRKLSASCLPRARRSTRALPNR